MKVVKGRVYTFIASPLDAILGKTDLKDGEKVRVIHRLGCPPPNTMNHAHVERLNGEFVGLVSCESLE